MRRAITPGAFYSTGKLSRISVAACDPDKARSRVRYAPKAASEFGVVRIELKAS